MTSFHILSISYSKQVLRKMYISYDFPWEWDARFDQCDRQRGGGIARYFEWDRDRRAKTLYPHLFQKKILLDFSKVCLSEAYFFYHYLLFEKKILYIILQKWSKKIKTVENAVYWEQKNVTPQSVHAYAGMDTLEKPVHVSHITKRYV